MASAATVGGELEQAQVELIGGAVRARLERVETLLAARQWDEALENLRQLSETDDDGLVALSARRFVGLRQWCQMRLASLPPEALAIYRSRIDPVARRWF